MLPAATYWHMNAKYRDEEKQAAWNEYLVLRCQEGDANALQELMRHWHSRLYGYALGQLQDADAAKDATQESLMSISKNIRRLRDPASFPKWAYQIVIRRCADWQRKELRWRARHVTDSAAAIDDAVSRPTRRGWELASTSGSELAPGAGFEPASGAGFEVAPGSEVASGSEFELASESGADTHALRRALATLEPELRNVVRLYYFDAFSLREIGELLQLPTGTIKSRLFYARKRLKQAIGDEER